MEGEKTETEPNDMCDVNLDETENDDNNNNNNNNNNIEEENGHGEEEKDGDEEDQRSTKSSDANNNQDGNGNGNDNQNDKTETEKDVCSPLKSLFEGLKNSIAPPEPEEQQENEQESDSDSDKLCPICLAEFEDDQDVCKSKNDKCQHMFHLDCMIEWLMKHNECPLCRNDYLKDSSSDNDGDEDNVAGDVERGSRARELGRSNRTLLSFERLNDGLPAMRRNPSFRLRL